MKKVLLSLTLFMTSFFFITINEVKAETYTLNIEETKFNLINDEFLSFREKALTYIEENNITKYAIYYSSSNSTYILAAGSSSTVSGPYLSSYVSNASGYYNLSVSINYMKHYKLENNTFTNISASNQFRVNIFYGGEARYYFLDTNMSISYTQEHIYNFTYNDKTYTIENGSTIPTLYEIYLDSHIPVDPFEEDKEILNNFYSIIFIKIGDLATSFASNYIFLLILGIFLLIFVFELIWRRFI